MTGDDSVIETTPATVATVGNWGAVAAAAQKGGATPMWRKWCGGHKFKSIYPLVMTKKLLKMASYSEFPMKNGDFP